ncbi:hypothetical protein E2320_001776, partial [Naja naja]
MEKVDILFCLIPKTFEIRFLGSSLFYAKKMILFNYSKLLGQWKYMRKAGYKIICTKFLYKISRDKRLFK